MKKNYVRNLVLASLFVALEIVFTRFFSVTIMNVERVSLTFLPQGLCGFLLGPVWGAVSGVVSDLLGMVINSAGQPYFIGWTISALIKGGVYGMMLHEKELSFVRILLTVLLVTVGIDLILNPLWAYLLYGQGYLAVIGLKLPIRLVYIPCAAFLLYWVLRGVKRALKRISH